MSDHIHRDEPWKKELVHGLHEFKEAVEHRGDREKENEREVRHIFDTVVVPVLEQFKADAEADRLQCVLEAPQNARSRSLTLRRSIPNSQPYLQVNFEWSASPVGVTLRAIKAGAVHDFLSHKKVSEVTHKDIADYLRERLREATEAEKVK